MRLIRSLFSIRLVRPGIQALIQPAHSLGDCASRIRFYQKMGLQFLQRKLQSGGKSTCSSTKEKIPRRLQPKPTQPTGQETESAGSTPGQKAQTFQPAGKGIATLEMRNASGLRTMATACTHPKVRIVSRHDDIEFVECLDCGEVFDSEEFR